MHGKATLELFGTLERLGKLFRRRLFGDSETRGTLVAMSYLFQEVWREGGTRIRMTDVSRNLAISKPAATQAVNRLVEQGWLERVSDENDRRVVYIQATGEGRRQFEQELERILSMADRVVSRMGEGEAQRLAVLLGEFFNALSAETEE